MPTVSVVRARDETSTQPSFVTLIDIGSNAMKLGGCRIEPGGSRSPATLAERITWLNQGLDEHGAVGEDAIQRVLDAAGELIGEAVRFDASVAGAVGTAALRSAVNRDEVLARLHSELGLRTRMLAPREEAAAGYLAVRERWLAGGGGGREPLVAFDLGGRSAEMTVGSGPAPDSFVSVELGSAHLFDLAPTSDPPVPAEIDRIRALASEPLKSLARPPREAHVHLVGATATTLAGYVPMLFAREYGPDPVHHLDRDIVRRLVAELAKMTIHERRQLPGNPERAKIILHGAIALEQAYKYLGFRHARVVPDGVAAGAVISELRGVPLDFEPVSVDLPAVDFRPLIRDDRDGEVLFALRRGDGRLWLQRKIDYPADVYRIPGGGIDRGEDPHAAFERELYEETGADGARAVPACTIRYRGPGGAPLAFYTRLYVVELEDHEPAPVDSDEGIEDYVPVAPEDLPRWADRLESLRGRMRPWGVFRAAAIRALEHVLARFPV